MTNDELLAELEIIKMLNEESRPEIELFKVPYLLFLLIIWYCRAGTWCQLKFSTLSESWFGSPTIFCRWEIVWDNILQNSSRFKVYLLDKIDQWMKLYLKKENEKASMK